ncbi:hypothetical protein EZV62_026423 [Acer yangbiense]|uniref:Gnk2-homologous domain-containing protein n=1 Tax=Acer yangbiense TaxID=1000413 RepID=A0A5C7GRJ3_9ROSI|nr:hypothetical protein EZV62_026423 [Acer yangbiense]
MKMSSLKFSMIFVFLLSLSSSMLTFTIAADPTHLYHVCSKSNFTRNSTYQSNLNLLLSSLPSNANHSDGFSNGTVGQDPNRVYGLFQCRGDVTTATCKDCIAFASMDLAQHCPAQKRAVIWYDECLVYYSDSYIFSTAASSPSVRMWNTNNVTTEPSRFYELVLGLMNKATTQAVNDPKKFTTIKGNSTTSQPLYVLVQCTQDLSNTNCFRCLQEAIANLSNESIGGRTLTPSCNCRYELYLFYNENLSLSSPPPAPAPTQSLPSPVTPTLSPPSPITRPKDPMKHSAVLNCREERTLYTDNNCYRCSNYSLCSAFCCGHLLVDKESKKKEVQFCTGRNCGYMSPEYAMHGQFSVKSNVYSFGVLVLDEIIAGKKKNNFYQTDGAADLLSYVSLETLERWNTNAIVGFKFDGF